MAAEWRLSPDERTRDGAPWTWPVLRGVPVPRQVRPARVEGSRLALKHTLATLAVGECFAVNGYPQKSGRTALQTTSLQVAREVRQYARDFGIRITCRCVGKGVVMVWRTA